MVRKSFLAFFGVVIGAAVILSDVPIGVAQDVRTSVAQEVQIAQARKRPGLFERLFGKKKAPQRVIRKKSSVRKRATTKRRSTKKRRPAAPVVKTVEVAAKDPNARKILVVGDYVASGVAWGLDQTLAEEPKLAVLDRFEGSSGLVRDDHYDWNDQILGVLNEETPDVVVVVIGANDRQDMRDGEARYPIRSPEWEALYTRRIDSLADTLNVYGRPFFWVGAPPLRGTDATADMAYLNTLYRPLVEDAGGHYVDIWNGFTNASGEFITTGPDIDGQNKALRTGDGVNFTSAGKLKLAYFVDRDIRRATGFGSGYVDLLASVTQSSTIEIGPDGKKRLVGPVLSLSDPQPGAGVELAGKPPSSFYDPISGRSLALPSRAAPPPDAEEETPQYRLVVKGESLPAVLGRIDNFAWPPSDSTGELFAALVPPEPVLEAGEADGEGAAEDPEPQPVE